MAAWGPAKGTCARVATLADPPGSQGVESAAFSLDGKILATSDQNGLTYLWDISEGRSAP